MAQAVTHFLFAALLAALFRDYYLKKRDKRKFPLHYVLVSGIGGVLPDIDLLFYIFLNKIVSFDSIHRTITHSFAFPLFIILLSIITLPFKNKTLGKHHIKLHTSFAVLAFGVLTHIILDAILIGRNIMPFYPFSDFSFGLDLINLLPDFLSFNAVPLLDGILLLIWIIYLEWKHKISDFI